MSFGRSQFSKTSGSVAFAFAAAIAGLYSIPDNLALHRSIPTLRCHLFVFIRDHAEHNQLLRASCRGVLPALETRSDSSIR